ncbi:anhydro-N-acetylmuramic acid kinase [Deefgea piscis]|uniref:Anhydro-N-acetylmuramic acid kinase n=1 Tax=Deefgea piscis TaxID=2739061 RepID=A0A6M8SVQ4_9NEIS|nr:anhydro-N-acetylmuramic acid kinase [Deefgea piscis]QKJ67666.1 anhydro-N-acetylmuramic acid kinase [Deefgea piscis]
MAQSNLYIGLMTGTSLDGIDAVIVDMQDSTPRLIASLGAPLPPQLRAQLLQLQSASHDEIHLAQLAANAHSLACAAVVATLLEKAQLKPNAIMAIGNHGQTIRHRPELGYTLQIGNHALLAEHTGITVVGDFRSRDVAAGGQGAPLVPAFHQAVFASPNQNRIILNIGGIANLSWLGQDQRITGFDSGPGNVLMDLWIHQHRGANYDADGAWAASGQILPDLLADMLTEPFFAQPAPKSTGRDLFHQTWLDQHLVGRNDKAADVQATLCALTANSISQAILSQGTPDEVLVCGGGAHNQQLMHLLTQQLSCPVSSTASVGIHPDWVEAFAFAWLAERCITRASANLPAVTGAQGSRILGAIWPN